MIPKNNELNFDFEIETVPSKTYYVNLDTLKVSGMAEGIEAIKQAIYFMLNIERYEYIIYSWDYGIELVDLFGRQTSYVLPELKRRITECLMQDDRIESVDNFEFEVNGNKVHATFACKTSLGSIYAEKTIEI